MPLSPPPRDARGVVVPHDHPDILPDHKIIRRVSPYHIAPDEKTPSGRRISTAAYQPSNGGVGESMSVDLEASILDAGADPRQYVSNPPFIGSVWFAAAFLRGESLMVGFDPLSENPHHGGVWGSFPRSRQKRLLQAAEWYVQIAGVDLK